jgi:hypothetical protein
MLSDFGKWLAPFSSGDSTYSVPQAIVQTERIVSNLLRGARLETLDRGREVPLFHICVVIECTYLDKNILGLLLSRLVKDNKEMCSRSCNQAHEGLEHWSLYTCSCGNKCDASMKLYSPRMSRQDTSGLRITAIYLTLGCCCPFSYLL